MAWRVANSLLTGRGELDRLFPHRPKTGQEGTIGNTAHVAEGWTLSDHNPWVTLNGIGVVRAWDIDCTATAEQITEGVSFDPGALAEYLAQLQRDRFAAFGTKGYVIWNRRITTSGNPGGVWQPYHGSDPHDRHIHVSVGTNPGEYDSTAAWNLAAAFDGTAALGGTATPITSEEDDMFSDQDRNALNTALRRLEALTVLDHEGVDPLEPISAAVAGARVQTVDGDALLGVLTKELQSNSRAAVLTAAGRLDPTAVAQALAPLINAQTGASAADIAKATVDLLVTRAAS